MSLRDVEHWLAMPFPRLGGPLGDFLFYDALLAGFATRFVGGEQIDPAMLPARDTESEQLAADVRSRVAMATADELTFLAYRDAMEVARRAMGDHTAGPRSRARVEWPWWRRDVMIALAYLADPEYQRRVWSDGGRDRDDDIDSWTHVVHTLWDDTIVLEEPGSTVGTILLPGAELERMSALAAVWRPVFDDLGPATASAFVSDPRWPDVVQGASTALRMMVLGGPATDGEGGP